MTIFWILLCAIIAIIIYTTYSRPISEPDLKLSSGAYDSVADNVLRHTTAKIASGKAEAADFFTHGRVIQHNLTENQMPEDVKKQIEADYRIALQLVEQEDVEIDTDRIFGNLLQFRPIGAISDAVETDANRKMTAALTKTTDRTEAVAQVIDSATIGRSDDQNVHDSSVTKGLSETMSIIVSSVPNHNVQKSIDELRQYAAGSGSPDAPRVIDTMYNASIVHPHGLPERDILSYVWERTAIAQNREKTEDLRKALLTALDESVDNGGIVCASGRTARVLSSGLLIDHDPRIGAVSTVQDIRRDLLREIKDMYAETINFDYHSDDEAKKSVAAYHLGHTKEEPDPIANELMNERLRKEISQIVDQRADLSDGDRARIIMESQVYLGVDED